MTITMNISGGFNRGTLVLAICLALTHFLEMAGQSKAEDDAPDKDAPARKAQLPLEDIEESLFGAKRSNSVPAIRIHLDQSLRRKLTSAEKTWRLNENQIQKLELAGRGDITRLFSVLEEHTRKLKAARQGANDVFDDNPLNRQTSIVRSKLRSGPFDTDSLFGKTLKQILTTEQAADFQKHQEVAAKSPVKISPANAADVLRTARLKKDTYRIVWNHDGTWVGLVEFRKNVEIYASPELQFVRTVGKEDNPVDFDFGPTENLIAIAKTSRDAAILDLASGTQIKLETGNPQPSVKFNLKDGTLVTGGYGKSAKLWSVSTGKQLREFAVGDVAGGLTPVFSRDGKMLAVGNRNSTTHLFDPSTGQLLHVLPKRSSHGLRFDPSGETLAVVYVDGSLVLWDTRTGQVKNQVAALANELYTVDWSADGSILATAGYNAPVRLWSAEDLSILNELECPEWVMSISFSPDGTKLLAAGCPRLRTDDKFVDIWAVP